MKFSDQTTAYEILSFYKNSVYDLLDELENMYDGYAHAKMPETMIAVKTRKKLLAWFDKRGGL